MLNFCGINESHKTSGRSTNSVSKFSFVFFESQSIISDDKEVKKKVYGEIHALKKKLESQ